MLNLIYSEAGIEFYYFVQKLIDSLYFRMKTETGTDLFYDEDDDDFLDGEHGPVGKLIVTNQFKCIFQPSIKMFFSSPTQTIQIR